MNEMRWFYGFIIAFILMGVWGYTGTFILALMYRASGGCCQYIF